MKTLICSFAVGTLFLCRSLGAEFVVTSLADSGPGTLRQAIIDSNETPGDDTITINASGVIELESRLPDIVDNTSFLGSGSSKLAVSGQSKCQAFAFANGTTNSLSGFSIINSLAPTNYHGGAISNAGTLVINGCKISNNRSVGGFGGAIYNSGTLKISDAEFANNSALGVDGEDSEGGGGGGGSAGLGGAIFNEGGSIQLSNTFFGTNVVTGGAGGSHAGSRTNGGAGGGPLGGLGGTFVTTNGAAGGFGSGGGGGNVGASAGGAGGFAGGSGGRGNDTFFNVCGGGGGGGGSAYGGAIFMNGGSFIADGCLFVANYASGGVGGGASYGGDGGSAEGGAVFQMAGYLRLDKCDFLRNQCSGGQGGNGGGAGGCGGAAGLAGKTSGGAVMIIDSEAIVEYANFEENRVVACLGSAAAHYGSTGGSASGGAINGTNSTITIRQCSIVGNDAVGGQARNSSSYGSAIGGEGLGGGISLNSGTLILTNCTLSGNDSIGGRGGATTGMSPSVYAGGFGKGAAVYIETGLLTAVNCSIVSNNACGGAGGTNGYTVGPTGVSYGGGIFNNANTFSALNCIFAGNTATNGPDGSGAFESLGFNLIGNTNALVGLNSNDIVAVDAKLGPLSLNEGRTKSHAPLPGSPALNTATTLGAPLVDQRGFNRPQGAGLDIGAVEQSDFEIFVNGEVVHSNSLAVAFATIRVLTPSGNVFYTLDGTAPSTNCTLYFGEFVVFRSVTLRAIVVGENGATELNPVNIVIIPGYTLNVTSMGGGTVVADPNLSLYGSNSVVELSAVPSAGKLFYQWDGDVAGTNPVVQLTMNTNKSVQAVFRNIPANQTITFNASSSVTYGTPLYLNAYSSSGLPVTMEVISGPATITNYQLYSSGIGQVTVRASQGGNLNYYPATNVDRTISILAATMQINASNSTRYYGDPNPLFVGSVTGVTNGDSFDVTFATTAGANSFPGDYAIYPIVNDSGGKLPNYNVVTNAGTLTILPQLVPQIVQQPYITNGGSGPAYSATVSATGGGLSYQWRYNGFPISGATNAVLPLPEFHWQQTTNYDVVVSNGAGETISNPAVLMVDPQSIPRIQQPYITNGGFGPIYWAKVVATGTDLNFQWRYNGIAISGATNSSVGLPSFERQEAANYDVVVWNNVGEVRSNPAILSVRYVRNDYDGDGWPDILFQHTNGALAAWFMQGTNFLSSGFIAGGKRAANGWRAFGTADFNFDGWSDIVFQNPNGRIAVWYLQSTNVIATKVLPYVTAAGWTPTCVATVALFTNSSVTITIPTPYIGFQKGAQGARWYMEDTNRTFVDKWSFGSARLLGGFPPNPIFFARYWSNDTIEPSLKNRIEVPGNSGPVYFSCPRVASGWNFAAFTDLELRGGKSYNILWQHANGRIACWWINGPRQENSVVLRSGKSAGSGWRVVQ